MNNFIFLKKEESDLIELISSSLSNESNMSFVITQLESIFYINWNQDLSAKEREKQLEEIYSEFSKFVIIHDATFDNLLTNSELEKELENKEGLKTDIIVSLKKLNNSNLINLMKYLKSQMEFLKENEGNKLSFQGLSKQLENLRNQDILTNAILFILVVVAGLFSYLQHSFLVEDIENLQVKDNKVEQSIDAINRDTITTNLKVNKVSSEVKDAKDSIENIVDLKKKEALNNLKFQMEQGILNESDIAQFILKDKKNKQDN